MFAATKLTVIVPELVPFICDRLTQEPLFGSLVMDHRSAPPPDFPIVTFCEATLLPDDAETLKVVGFTTTVCPNTDSGTNKAATAIRTRALMTERECMYGLLPKCVCVRTLSCALLDRLQLLKPNWGTDLQPGVITGPQLLYQMLSDPDALVLCEKPHTVNRQGKTVLPSELHFATLIGGGDLRENREASFNVSS